MLPGLNQVLETEQKLATFLYLIWKTEVVETLCTAVPVVGI